MIPFLKLIRFKNLLIIAFTQYMVRWFLLFPILKASGLTLQMGEIDFFLLCLSTVMVAAAGYAINDYFDVNIDKVNKPERLVIDHGVKRRVAIGAHTVINFLAVCIGFAVSWRIGFWKLGFIHLLCASGLWMYSTNFKRMFFIGNFVIASFTALVPLIVGIYELLLCQHNIESSVNYQHAAWTWILALTFFAFITTLLREIIKDIEDLEGDREYGCRTMPVIIGSRASKNVAIAITAATIFSLGWIQLLLFNAGNLLGVGYLLLLVQFPLLALIVKTHKAENKMELHKAGMLAKYIMLAGICYLFIFTYTVFKQNGL